MFLYCTSNRGLNRVILNIPDQPDWYAVLYPMMRPGRGHTSLQSASYATTGQGQKCNSFHTISLLKVKVTCIHDYTAHPRSKVQSIDERHFISERDKTWQLKRKDEENYPNVSTDFWIIDRGWLQYKNWLQELFSIIITHCISFALLQNPGSRVSKRITMISRHVYSNPWLRDPILLSSLKCKSYWKRKI